MARDLTAKERAELLQVTKEDLQFVESLDLNSAPQAEAAARVIQDQQVLRGASARMRRLVLEDGILRVRHTLGLRGEPRMRFFPIDESSQATFVQSAGAKRGGTSITGLAVHATALSPEEVRASYERGRQLIDGVEAPMSAWRSSVCMVVEGVTVTRDDVIKYVANKLGGVHFQPRRNPTKDAAYIALDWAERVNALGLDSRYFEFLSIVQQFRSSTEVQEAVQLVL